MQAIPKFDLQFSLYLQSLKLLVTFFYFFFVLIFEEKKHFMNNLISSKHFVDHVTKRSIQLKSKRNKTKKINNFFHKCLKNFKFVCFCFNKLQNVIDEHVRCKGWKKRNIFMKMLFGFWFGQSQQFLSWSFFRIVKETKK